MRTVRLDTIDASRRAERMGGWLGPLTRDPAADPPDFPEGLNGCRTPPITLPDEPKR